MKYMLNIYSDASLWDDATPEDIAAELKAYGAFDEAVEQHGAFVAGEGLESPETATTVRMRNGERLVTDGPFAETKEQLGGFYVLDCKDLDEAIEWAAKIPGAQEGTIEIRPVISYEA